MQENRNNVQDSEVARLRQQLDAECEAAWLAMFGYAEVAKHDAITARMENVGRLHEELKEIAGDDADQMLVEAMQKSGEL